MKVITLDDRRFQQACHDLWATAISGGEPDIVLGIRSGGYVVAQIMVDGAQTRKPVLLPITRRRASTARKKGNPWIGWILKRTPYPITDRIRVLEHGLLSGRRAMKKAAEAGTAWEPDPAESATLAAALAEAPEAQVLIVDDALDTGSTLKSVDALVRSLAPRAAVRSAVLVRTTENPMIKPNVSLYTNVLCRFPWSHDFAN